MVHPKTILVNSGDPIADFSVNPVSVKPGDTVTVDASASYDLNGTIASYKVDYGDGGPYHSKLFVSYQYLRAHTVSRAPSYLRLRARDVSSRYFFLYFFSICETDTKWKEHSKSTKIPKENTDSD